jgi:hypothetical protein
MSETEWLRVANNDSLRVYSDTLKPNTDYACLSLDTEGRIQVDHGARFSEPYECEESHDLLHRGAVLVNEFTARVVRHGIGHSASYSLRDIRPEPYPRLALALNMVRMEDAGLRGLFSGLQICVALSDLRRIEFSIKASILYAA